MFLKKGKAKNPKYGQRDTIYHGTGSVLIDPLPLGSWQGESEVGWS